MQQQKKKLKWADERIISAKTYCKQSANTCTAEQIQPDKTGEQSLGEKKPFYVTCIDVEALMELGNNS